MNNCYNWIKTKLREHNLDKQWLYNNYDTFMLENEDNSYSKESYKRKVRLAYEELVEDGEQFEFDEESYIKLEAQKQRYQDLNNVAKKSNRENYRLYNYLETIFEEYTSLLKKIELPKIQIKKNNKVEEDKVGILQLSDLHFNEIIFPEESFGNAYDFTIASKRLKKYVMKATKVFDMNNIQTVYILMTGDFMNSSRRLGEKLAQATSLVRASLLATYLLEQVILELSQKYNIYFSGVVGNESRLGDDDMDSSDILSSENWDYLIYNNLRLIFNDKTNVYFIKPDSNMQSIIKLPNGFNVLILHGHIFKSQPNEKAIAMLIQRYLYQGIPIHAVLYGHYHSAQIGSIISRSGSLCGGNAYSSTDLMYLSHASQNIYIINKDLSYDGMTIDLQSVEDIDGYQIVSELERYNVPNKLRPTMEIISQNLV